MDFLHFAPCGRDHRLRQQFATFPEASGADPVADGAANFRTLRRMPDSVARKEDDDLLADTQGRQDLIMAQEIARRALAKGDRLTSRHSS